MKSKMTARIIFIAASIVLAIYMLYPTIKLSMMSDEEKESMMAEDKDAYMDLQSKSVSLGLDLLGGMHVVLEVDVRELMDKLARNKNPEFVEAINATNTIVNKTDEDFVTILLEQLGQKGMNIQRYYGTAERRTQEDVVAFLRTQMEEAVDRSLEILRNRIDQFGVTEPTIQKQGGRRIILELAGVEDRDRVNSIIGKTAKLEFKLLKDEKSSTEVAEKINEFITARVNPADTVDSEASDVEADTSSSTALEEMFGVDETEVADSGSDSSAVKKTDSIFEEGLFYQSPYDGNTILVGVEKEDKFKDVIELPAMKKIIAETAGSAEYLWGSKPQFEDQFLSVYLVNKKEELSGESIIEAIPRPASMDDPTNIGKFEVTLTFDDNGAKIFSRVTGANIGKRLAIILDQRVYLAPTLQTKISNGRARITGIESFDEARDLAIVLKAGALPAPVHIMEERTVGPSLGYDSIISGSYSAAFGLMLVMLFMILYYKLSGLVADLALVTNIVFIMAIMASLGATLTLPGIAGIILTIGMAVDANVLIFERVREELAKGKTIRASLDIGYGKAFITILDANVTTFIAGLVLYTYGSGPIKGFAVTLMIGIVASMFTAVVISRVIFNSVLNKRTVSKLSI